MAEEDLRRRCGSPLLRFLWGEAGAHAVRRDPELKRFYRRKLFQKGSRERHAWRWRASWGSGYGSCGGMRSIITSSVVADRSNNVVRPVVGMPETAFGAKNHRPVD